jgi:hypothetical protein
VASEALAKNVGGTMKLDEDVSGLKYPEWQKTVQAALMEIDKGQLGQKMADAEIAIFQRLQELSNNPEGNAEQVALEEASRALLVVKKEILKYPGW